jgi:hypothetical protein
LTEGRFEIPQSIQSLEQLARTSQETNKIPPQLCTTSHKIFNAKLNLRVFGAAGGRQKECEQVQGKYSTSFANPFNVAVEFLLQLLLSAQFQELLPIFYFLSFLSKFSTRSHGAGGKKKELGLTVFERRKSRGKS